MMKRVGVNRYVVLSNDGKQKLSKPLSRAAAVKRLANVQQPKGMTQ
jgi:hypothetical protein